MLLCILPVLPSKLYFDFDSFDGEVGEHFHLLFEKRQFGGLKSGFFKIPFSGTVFYELSSILISMELKQMQFLCGTKLFLKLKADKLIFRIKKFSLKNVAKW